MALQLPEPDYYTLKEILERWGTTETILFRLAREGKVRMGFDPRIFSLCRYSALGLMMKGWSMMKKSPRKYSIGKHFIR